MTFTQLHDALETAFPPSIVVMPPPFGETKIYQFQAQIVEGQPQVFLTDPTPERLAILDQVLSELV